MSILRLECHVQQLCKEVLRMPLINLAWEQALAIWGQHSMSADERRRRMMTHTLQSSPVRQTMAACKFLKQQVHTHTQESRLVFLINATFHKLSLFTCLLQGLTAERYSARKRSGLPCGYFIATILNFTQNYHNTCERRKQSTTGAPCRYAHKHTPA